jgi:hypothetical protein
VEQLRAGCAAFFRMELDRVDVDAFENSGELRAVGARGNSAYATSRRVGVREIEVGVWCDAFEQSADSIPCGAALRLPEAL